MMRFYSSILMSSLLLSSTAVNAQSLETRSTFLSQDKSVTELLTPQAQNQTFYADSDPETLPERGSGRGRFTQISDKETLLERGSGRKS